MDLQVYIGQKVIRIPLHEFQGRSEDGWELLKQSVAKEAFPAGAEAYQFQLVTFAGTTLSDQESLQQLGPEPTEAELMCCISKSADMSQGVHAFQHQGKFAKTMQGDNVEVLMHKMAHDQYTSGLDALSDMADDSIQACLLSDSPEVELVLDTVRMTVAILDNGIGIAVDEGAVIAELSRSGLAQLQAADSANQEATENAKKLYLRCLQDAGAIAAHGFGLEGVRAFLLQPTGNFNVISKPSHQPLATQWTLCPGQDYYTRIISSNTESVHMQQLRASGTVMELWSKRCQREKEPVKTLARNVMDKSMALLKNTIEEASQKRRCPSIVVKGIYQDAEQAQHEQTYHCRDLVDDTLLTRIMTSAKAVICFSVYGEALRQTKKGAPDQPVLGYGQLFLAYVGNSDIGRNMTGNQHLGLNQALVLWEGKLLSMPVTLLDFVQHAKDCPAWKKPLRSFNLNALFGIFVAPRTLVTTLGKTRLSEDRLLLDMKDRLDHPCKNDEKRPDYAPLVQRWMQQCVEELESDLRLIGGVLHRGSQEYKVGDVGKLCKMTGVDTPDDVKPLLANKTACFKINSFEVRHDGMHCVASLVLWPEIADSLEEYQVDMAFVDFLHLDEKARTQAAVDAVPLSSLRNLKWGSAPNSQGLVVVRGQSVLVEDLALWMQAGGTPEKKVTAAQAKRARWTSVNVVIRANRASGDPVVRVVPVPCTGGVGSPIHIGLPTDDDAKLLFREAGTFHVRFEAGQMPLVSPSQEDVDGAPGGSAAAVGLQPIRFYEPIIRWHKLVVKAPRICDMDSCRVVNPQPSVVVRGRPFSLSLALGCGEELVDLSDCDPRGIRVQLVPAAEGDVAVCLDDRAPMANICITATIGAHLLPGRSQSLAVRVQHDSLPSANHTIMSASVQLEVQSAAADIDVAEMSLPEHLVNGKCLDTRPLVMSLLDAYSTKLEKSDMEGSVKMLATGVIKDLPAGEFRPRLHHWQIKPLKNCHACSPLYRSTAEEAWGITADTMLVRLTACTGTAAQQTSAEGIDAEGEIKHALCRCVSMPVGHNPAAAGFRLMRGNEEDGFEELTVQDGEAALSGPARSAVDDLHVQFYDEAGHDCASGDLDNLIWLGRSCGARPATSVQLAAIAMPAAYAEEVRTVSLKRTATHTVYQIELPAAGTSHSVVASMEEHLPAEGQDIAGSVAVTLVSGLAATAKFAVADTCTEGDTFTVTAEVRDKFGAVVDLADKALLRARLGRLTAQPLTKQRGAGPGHYSARVPALVPPGEHVCKCSAKGAPGLVLSSAEHNLVVTADRFVTDIHFAHGHAALTAGSKVVAELVKAQQYELTATWSEHRPKEKKRLAALAEAAEGGQAAMRFAADIEWDGSLSIPEAALQLAKLADQECEVPGVLACRLEIRVAGGRLGDVEVEGCSIPFRYSDVELQVGGHVAALNAVKQFEPRDDELRQAVSKAGDGYAAAAAYKTTLVAALQLAGMDDDGLASAARDRKAMCTLELENWRSDAAEQEDAYPAMEVPLPPAALGAQFGLDAAYLTCIAEELAELQVPAANTEEAIADSDAQAAAQAAAARQKATQWGKGCLTADELAALNAIASRRLQLSLAAELVAPGDMQQSAADGTKTRLFPLLAECAEDEAELLQRFADNQQCPDGLLGSLGNAFSLPSAGSEEYLRELRGSVTAACGQLPILVFKTFNQGVAFLRRRSAAGLSTAALLSFLDAPQLVPLDASRLWHRNLVIADCAAYGDADGSGKDFDSYWVCPVTKVQKRSKPAVERHLAQA
ncbi:hypothetical protein WJX72_008041 [[Myrmecia] bisecta]|uniref:Uncharacterized protein n=1 Tax=[Myrmecia] bisecta TaxID=41462 RepID=A0AAW1R7T7_9CHLO